MWPFKRELWERGFCQTTESSTRRPLPWHRGSSFQKNSQNLKMFFNEKQPEPQNIFQWKTTRTSKCFSMKNNKALTLFPPLSASAQQRRNWLFFLKSAQCLLKFAARRKTFQPWTFWGSLWANYSNVENNQTQRFDNLLLSIIEKWTSRPVEKIIGLQLSQVF